MLLQRISSELQAIIDAVPDYIFVKDRENRFVRGNRAFAKSLGVQVTELPGMSAFDLFDVEIAKQFWADDLEVIKSDVPKMNIVEEGRTESGAGWFSTDKVPLRSENGHVTGVVGISRNISAQMEADLRLREKSELLHNVLESLTYPFYVINTDDYRIVLANRASGLNAGRTARRCYEHIRGVDNPCADKEVCPVEIVRNTKSPFTCEHVIKGEDGSQKVFEVHAYPLFDAKGKVSQIIEYQLDITTRKAAEEALLESESRLQSFYDATFESIAITQAGRFVDVNRRFCETFGFGHEEIIGRPVADFVHPDDAEMVSDKILSGYAEPYEHRVLRKDGSVFFVEVRGHRSSYKGRPARVTAIQDITESRKALEALQASEEKFRSLFEQSRDSILVSTPEGRIVDANMAALVLMGVESKEDLLGIDAEEMYDNPDDMALFRTEMDARGYVNDFETVLRRRDGSKVTVRLSANTIREEKGARETHRVTISDISEQEQLRRQLLHAQKMESLGVLAGGIAHDFNNILTPIMANIGYLQVSLPQDDPVLEVLGEIMSASERARDLVQQILSFSRREETHRKPVLLQPIVKETLKLIRSSMPATIRIRSRIDHSIGPVTANASQFHQVLMNLLTNAHDAMKDSGGELEVRIDSAGAEDLEGREAPGATSRAYAKISVRDNGPGMDEETASRVFEPYFTTKGAGEGSGLGLAVVHGIVRAHEGSIAIKSAPGEGTTVAILLPVGRAEREVADGASSHVQGGTERILLVDDEREILNISGRILSSLGYRVNPFLSSADALEEFLADPMRYDLIMTDQTLPDLTGAELMKEVHAVRPEMPVIICTGYSHKLDRDQALKLGARNFLIKPFTMRSLAGAVRLALDESS